MLTFPNLLSLLRIALAFFFLQDDYLLRAAAIILALATDGLDGYYARKYHQITRVGILLDPIADKIFVGCAITIFIAEGRLSVLEAVALISRDLSLLLFGIYLLCANRFGQYQFRPFWCGKISTVLQLLILFALTFNLKVASPYYLLCVLLGAFALGELYRRRATP